MGSVSLTKSKTGCLNKDILVYKTYSSYVTEQFELLSQLGVTLEIRSLQEIAIKTLKTAENFSADVTFDRRPQCVQWPLTIGTSAVRSASLGGADRQD